MAFNIRDAVMELERHAAEQGWDQAPRVYALVATSDLLEREPHLAEILGISQPVSEGDLTPVEQEPLPQEMEIDAALGRMAWPEAVTGCALVMEGLVAKDSNEMAGMEGVDGAADSARPDGEANGAAGQGRPATEEVRMVAGVLRDGERYSAVRMRAYDSEEHVLNGTDLVPNLTSALALTLEDDG
ncbi:PPA1309 family protein [Salinactinospora qingdaonensis]|uniref:PPA1309 family protein n=2 Tax=Salinactinospora qingdaonensis TaxID=702744 RepID=A0ABP7GH63_9ACTN